MLGQVTLFRYTENVYVVTVPGTTLNVPLKLNVLFAGLFVLTPEINTAPGEEAFNRFDVSVVKVAMLPLAGHDAPPCDGVVLLAGAIATVLSVRSRLTTEVAPAPPGVTYASGTSGCMITCGVVPVFSDRLAMAHGAVCDVDALKHVWL